MADPIRSDADLIRASEGLRLAAYDDATGEPVPAGGQCKGTLTIGRGHTGPDVYAGQVCTTAEAEAWFQWDLARARRRAAAALGPDHWARLDEVRRAALTDMAFCLGGVGLSRFALMLQAVAAGVVALSGTALTYFQWADEELAFMSWLGTTSLTTTNGFITAIGFNTTQYLAVSPSQPVGGVPINSSFSGHSAGAG